MNQENIRKKLHRPITTNGTESITKSLPTKKTPGTDGFTAELYQTFKEALSPMLLELFHITERKGTMRSTLPYYQNLTRTNSNDNKNYRPTSLMNIDAKIFNKILTN